MIPTSRLKSLLSERHEPGNVSGKHSRSEGQTKHVQLLSFLMINPLLLSQHREWKPSLLVSVVYTTLRFRVSGLSYGLEKGGSSWWPRLAPKSSHAGEFTLQIETFTKMFIVFCIKSCMGLSL